MRQRSKNSWIKWVRDEWLGCSTEYATSLVRRTYDKELTGNEIYKRLDILEIKDLMAHARRVAKKTKKEREAEETVNAL